MQHTIEQYDISLASVCVRLMQSCSNRLRREYLERISEATTIQFAKCSSFAARNIHLVQSKSHNFFKSFTQLIESSCIMLLYVFNQVTPEMCLTLSIRFSDVIDHSLETGNKELVVESQMILTAMLHSLLEFDYDPRNALKTIKASIQRNVDQSMTDDVCNFTLITMSQIIHLIAPFYLSHALDVVAVRYTLSFYLNDLFDVCSKAIITEIHRFC